MLPISNVIGKVMLSSFISVHGKKVERFSYDLETKTREQNRNKNERKQSDLIVLSNGYKRAWLLVG